MSNRDAGEVPFEPGDVVFQASRGITGCVVEITGGLEPRVLVQFGDSPLREMSVGVATTALTKLHPFGLRAQAIKKRDALVACEKDNPLKLIALALVDLGGTAKVSAIRKEIENTRLLSTRWETWWKRVQPVLKQSSHFRRTVDGSYQLLTDPDRVREVSLPRVARKEAGVLSRSQVLQLIQTAETEGLSLDDVHGSRAKHLVARELVKRSSGVPQLKRVLLSSIDGTVVSARIVLDEYIKKEDKQSILDALIALLEHVSDLLSSSDGRQTSAAQHVNAKIRLFQDKLALTISRLGANLEVTDMLSLNSRLLVLATQLVHSQAGGRRTEACSGIMQSIATVAAVWPHVLNATVPELAGNHVNPDLCARVAKGILDAIPASDIDDALRRLLVGALVLPVDYSDSLVQNLLRRDRRLQWLAESLGDILHVAGPDSCSTINALIDRIGAGIRDAEEAGFVKLAMAVALKSPAVSVSLSQSVRARISAWSSNTCLEERDDTTADEEAVLRPIKIAIEARVVREKKSWEEARGSLLSEIADLQARNAESEETVNRLQGVIDDLKSGYHMPEKWVEYRARKHVLERLGVLYQEIHSIRQEKQRVQEMDHILRQIETILAKSGVSLLGREGTTVLFNPAQYEFIRGTETSEEKVRVRCPGFIWRDPANNSVVLVRARVSRQ